MVFFNEAEWIRAKEILGISSPEQLISNPRQILTITYGERGSEIYHFTGTEVTVEIIEPIKVDNVIDHTGAGDNYKAGFLASYSTGRELREAGMLGSLLGARAVENQGGILPPSVITEASANFKVK
jgi:sugar/nucleoside kinase (ribokinase family)